MTAVLESDTQALRQALSTEGNTVSVSLSRNSAEFLASALDAQARGQKVIFTQGHNEVTSTEAAKLLGMSRPQVRKLLDQGKLPYRLVGSHHRIPMAAISTFLDIESKRQRAAMAELVALQNELGLIE